MLGWRIIQEVMRGTPPAANWSVAPLHELIRHIVLEYHDCLRLELPALRRRMAQAPAAQAALRVFEEALDANLDLQEEVLFPAIRKCEEAADAGWPLPARAAVAIRDLIPEIKQDQSRLAALLHKVRQEAGVDQPPELKDLEADLRVHFHLKNDILFQRVMQLVSSGQIESAERL